MRRSTARNFRQEGRAAFDAGVMRWVPRDLLIECGADAAREWYRGWDEANLAGPWEIDQ